jgi:drug/metabolite transporter (DMT)-like permease
MPGRPAGALISIVSATALWGASGGVVAGTEADGVALASLVELATGALLLAVAVGRRQPLLAAVTALRWWLPLLGAIEAANVALYYVALQVAPLGPVMAMHLTAPVILSGLAIARGDLTWTRRRVLSVALICAALGLITVRRPETSKQAPVLGVALSLMSAACLAVFITVAKRTSHHAPPAALAGSQMLVSGLLLAPAALFAPVPTHELPRVGLTILLFAPATWLYWHGIRGLSAITAGTIQLAEPVFGAITAAILSSTTPGPLDYLIALLVLAAVRLEVRQPIVPRAPPDDAEASAPR